MENENVVKEPVKMDKKALAKKALIAGAIALGLGMAYKVFGPKKSESEQEAGTEVAAGCEGVTANEEKQPEVTE